MLRTFRLVMIVLVAMFIVAVPTTAMAQSPTTDQYQNVPPGGHNPVDDGGSLPTDDGLADDGGSAPADDGGSAPADDGGSAPVDVANAPSATSGKLPFTGGQMSLIALIGLGLLALGVVGLVASRRRDAAAA